MMVMFAVACVWLCSMSSIGYSRRYMRPLAWVWCVAYVNECVCRRERTLIDVHHCCVCGQLHGVVGVRDEHYVY